MSLVFVRDAFTYKSELNIGIQFSILLVFQGRTTAQAVSRRSVNAETRAGFQVITCEVCGGKKWHKDTF
jgi:hypothetical protein